MACFPSSRVKTSTDSLRARRWRLAGAERGSCFLQFAPNRRGKRVRTAKHASRDSFRVPERIHGLAEIIEGGAVGVEERRRVIPPAAGGRRDAVVRCRDARAVAAASFFASADEDALAVAYLVWVG